MALYHVVDIDDAENRGKESKSCAKGGIQLLQSELAKARSAGVIIVAHTARRN